MGADSRQKARKRALIVAALLALGYLGVAARLMWLQVIKHDDLSARAVRQQSELIDLPPKRGTIYDRTGNELAVSIDADSLYAVPANIPEPKAVAARLAPIICADKRALESKLTGNRKFVWLARKVAPDVPGRIKAAGQFKDELGWLSDSRRYYPNKTLAGNVLGFTGTDNNGLEGLESFYQDYVGGVAGHAVTVRDGAGHEVLSFEDGYKPPRPGCDITLTLDEKVQYIVEKELDIVMEKYHPLSATAIVMDPKTGGILAMASRPGFNPNCPGECRQGDRRNRPVTDTYEPGSTFKVITASAALEEGAVKPTDMIDCGDGSIEVGGRVIHNAHKEGGRKTFAEVIQKSDNVGTIRVALRLGKDRLYRYARAFGIGQATGVDLPGEVAGRLRDVARWNGQSSTASIAIGQEVSVTPLQMLTAINCIANGGCYIQPHIVSEIRSDDGGLIKKDEPKVARRVISGQTARKLADILATVVEEGGTAVSANIKGYQVAGKTGTAQKYDPALRRYSKEKFTSSFVGFVPADDPKLSAIVVLDQPRGAYYGGVVAAPAFKSIAEKTLTYMKVPTRLPERTVLVER